MKNGYILYEDHEDFFRFVDKGVMLFSRAAAKRVFELAGSRGIEIWRYEGGILASGRFEARLDAIWDRYRLHEGLEFLEQGNLRAAEALGEEPEDYNAFCITGGPVKRP